MIRPSLKKEVSTSYRIFLITCLVGSWTASAGAQVPERTVIDNERACTFSGTPFDGYYSGLGFFMGNSFQYGVDWMAEANYLSGMYLRMQPDAIKGATQLYLQHLDPQWDAYIYSDLKAFEQDEVRQGRAPFFITATYQGQKRPVIFLPRLTEPFTEQGGRLAQAVDVGNDRFIKFWLKNGIRRRRSPYGLQSWGICEDNTYFKQDKYAVLDDTGAQRQVTWDRPFPQDDTEWADAAKYGLRRIKELAPDLILVQNQYGTPVADMSRYAEVFAPIDGVFLEGFIHAASEGVYGIHSDRNKFWTAIQRLLPPDGPDAYKIQVFPIEPRSLAELPTQFLAHLIFCGPNAFIDVRAPGGAKELDPQYYAKMQNVLGAPVEPPQSLQEPGKMKGWRLWWRKCEGGLVYLNLTETTKVIPLPGSGPFYDPRGNGVSQIALNDLVAGYVTTEAGDRMAKPRINPRRPGLVTGPLTITLDTEPFTARNVCEITYTLDGSEPGEKSAVYTNPFKIHESCVVKARAFSTEAGYRVRPLPSFTNTATYRLTDQVPTVQFHLPGDSGSEFMEYDYPVVSLSHVSAIPITVKYQACGGTATPGRDYVLDPGMLTFAPGEQHRYFCVHIVNDTETEPNETIMLSLSDPTNATLGENTTYTYTIEDNDPPPDLIEDFESGSFASHAWSSSGDANWTVDSSEAHGGLYCAGSGRIADDECTTLSLYLTGPYRRITFYCKVSSELFCDCLVFSIDGVEKGRWSGEQDWTQCTYTIYPGEHTLSWSYCKDGSSSKGLDCAWLDDLRCSSE
jgi:hypothetical protein